MSDHRIGRPRTITRDIELLLSEKPGADYSPTQVWQRLITSGHSYNLDSVQVAMQRMLHRGELERVGYGLYKLTGVDRTPIEYVELITRVPSGLSLHSCSACAGVTTDPEQHTQWHEEQG